MGPHLGVVRLSLRAFAAAATGKDAFLGQVKDQPGVVGWLLATARQFHLLPEAYIYGSGLTVQFASERASFLNGQFANDRLVVVTSRTPSR